MSRAADHSQRQLLGDHWQFAVAVQDAGGAPCPPPDGPAWRALSWPMPVTAALRDLGLWSLDMPERRFDAETWYYRLRFASPAGQPGARIILGLDGLATLATGCLNGHQILASDNMFLAHECDVTDLLQDGENELVLCFHPLDDFLATRRKRPRWKAPMVAHQQLRWCRTTLLGRTPGWSPPAAIVGPWRDIWLECRGGVVLKGVRLGAAVRGDAGVLACRVELDTGGVEVQTLAVELEHAGQCHVQPLMPGPQPHAFSGEMLVAGVRLWWPHTHGEPALYRATLRGRLAGQAEMFSIDLGRIGFRTVAVDTADGAFSLSVNGVPVFCRGACWTPLDAASLRSDPAQCSSAIAQAREAGMNMLRVPGTTVYEEDHFYEACDEQGMLVWQDFMFANMDYPEDDEAFQSSVTAEVRQQLLRLQAMPCVAVLCGGSELGQQAAMWGAHKDVWQAPLFSDALAQLCAELAPLTPYWPSSTHGGSFPHQVDSGTCSYYGVGAYLRPLEDARRANVRFATESLAIANVPSAATIARMPGGPGTKVHHAAWKARSPRDLGAGWDFDDVRDHYLASLFGVDPQALRRTDHERYLALSRLVSGEVMAAAFSQWRSPGSSCRGSLVLFLRDFWAGAGWGLVDDTGAPKACLHYLRRALQPLAVVLADEGLNGLLVHIVNEQAHDRPVVLEMSAWRGGDVRVAAARKSLTVRGRSTHTIPALDLLEHFMDLTWAYRFGPAACEVIAVSLGDEEGRTLARAFHFPCGQGFAVENDVGLDAEVTHLDDTTAQLMVSTRRFAQGVHLDVPGFAADEDYFHLVPGAGVCVRLTRIGQGPLRGFVHAVNSLKSAVIADGVVTRAAGVDLRAEAA